MTSPALTDVAPESRAASAAPILSPRRALLHPAWLAAVAVLALNDHVFKGASLLPAVVTGKLSDFAGLFAAPALLAALLGVSSTRALACCHLATGAVFTAIKVSGPASELFTSALALAHLPWRNVVDPTDLVALVALLASFVVLGPRMATGPRAGGLSLAAVALALPVMLGSGDSGGANQQERKAGGGDSGVNLADGEIAIDPLGEYFLARTAAGDLLLGELSTRRTQAIVGLEDVALVTFFAPGEGAGFFAITGDGATDRKLVAYSVAERRVRWSRPEPRGFEAMAVAALGGRLVAWSSGGGVTTIDAATGEERGHLATPQPVRDVDVTGEIIVTEEHTGEPGKQMTTLRKAALADASQTCALSVPNCSSELVIGATGERAFLAPTFCGRDPVSVVDLAGCTFEKNLPGFGPVALSEGRTTAVAFIDNLADDPEAPPLPDDVKASATRYHLMFIDTVTLAYTTMPVGDELPRFAVTPDGKVLLVDSFLSEENLRLLDIAKRQIVPITGPQVLLENYVMLRDSSAAFALFRSNLYRVDITQQRSSNVPLSFTPTTLNVTPSGSHVLLKDRKGGLHMLRVADQTELGVFE